MAKPKRKQSRTDDKHVEGVKRIDAPPDEIARQALFSKRMTRRPKSPAQRRKT